MTDGNDWIEICAWRRVYGSKVAMVGLSVLERNVTSGCPVDGGCVERRLGNTL